MELAEILVGRIMDGHVANTTMRVGDAITVEV